MLHPGSAGPAPCTGEVGQAGLLATRRGQMPFRRSAISWADRVEGGALNGWHGKNDHMITHAHVYLHMGQNPDSSTRLPYVTTRVRRPPPLPTRRPPLGLADLTDHLKVVDVVGVQDRSDTDPPGPGHVGAKARRAMRGWRGWFGSHLKSQVGLIERAVCETGCLGLCGWLKGLCI